MRNKERYFGIHPFRTRTTRSTIDGSKPRAYVLFIIRLFSAALKRQPWSTIRETFLMTREGTLDARVSALVVRLVCSSVTLRLAH